MKVLIVKTSSLGDIIHTFPVLQFLHEKHPGVSVDWVVEAPFAELVRAHPLVNQVFPVDTKKWRKAVNLKLLVKFACDLRKTRYDVLFDFQGNTKSALFTFLAKADKKAGFGKKTVPEWPNLLTTNFKANPDTKLNVRKENLFLAQSYFNDFSPFAESGVKLRIAADREACIEKIMGEPLLQNKRKIMVCPGSAWPNKQLTTSCLINFLKKTAGQTPSAFLFIWGNEAEKNTAQQLKNALPGSAVIIDKMPIPVLQNLMDRMDLVITMDSLPLHLAGTTSAKTFSVFGASSACKYKPDGPQHKAFQGRCPYGREFLRRCPILRTCPTGACIREIDADELFRQFMESHNPEL